MIKVSVIIPVEKENENLRKCLAALGRQTFKNFEIIVVSDKFQGVPSAKRNWGARKAKGEILAFLDDDCWPEREWIERGVEILELPITNYQLPNLGAIAGPMVTPPNSPVWERMGGYLCESFLVFGGEVYRNKISTKREVSDYPCANFFMRKADFQKLGGFDERFWPGEDTKLCLDIVDKLKKKIAYDPSVVVYHRRRPLFGPFLEQIARYGRQRGRFVKCFPKTSRKIGYFLPSFLIIYLIICLFFWRLGIGIYLVPVFFEGVRMGMRERNLAMGLVFMAGVVATHFVYGVNFIRGIL